MWKHTNNNSCWVKPSDMNTNIKPHAVKAFHEHVELIRLQSSKLFSGLMADQGHKIKISYLGLYCNQLCNLFKKGTWSENSTSMEGIYDEYFELLEMIEFLFE